MFELLHEVIEGRAEGWCAIGFAYGTVWSIAHSGSDCESEDGLEEGEYRVHTVRTGPWLMSTQKARHGFVDTDTEGFLIDESTDSAKSHLPQMGRWGTWRGEHAGERGSGWL